jgi:hypothetical protein
MDTNKNNDQKIDFLKQEQLYFTNLIIEVENIGYDFQESSGTYVPLKTSDLNELNDIMEIEENCRKIKQLLNKIYSNKIKSLSQ